MKKAVVVVVSIISIAVLVTVLVLVLTPKKESPPVQSIVDMILVEKGTFTMGDTWGTGWDEERPAHEVTISYDFHIGKHEITFELYDLFCQETERTLPEDEGWGRGQRPVINVSWMDAAAFCNWLSEREKLPKAYDSNGYFLDKDGKVTTDPSKVVGYRLPTEAEWEYAARGGNKSEGYIYSGGNEPDLVAWYSDNSGDITHEVGQKSPNELGIFDMSGNVSEWCSDAYDAFFYRRSPGKDPYNQVLGNKSIRGRAWWDGIVRVTSRSYNSPNSEASICGFRICRNVS
ncbi:formylglycine-generating enzyme family protein [Mesotoga sp. BH458_6_3_2_1]|uniref:formylglycine-generating enzyme family protein n=1 Tax=Mesotoga sp. BH458_6_3_2_1 TaxID=1437446 RepID=UPI000EF1FF5E|nr:formylglycine-generating enzyme family protein [Mesotoga sp. BH458_6_3_2_1]